MHIKPSPIAAKRRLGSLVSEEGPWTKIALAVAGFMVLFTIAFLVFAAAVMRGAI